MHKNKFTALDKCIVLLSYINDRNPELYVKIIESLPSHYSQEILNRLKDCPLYDRLEVEKVLEEYHDLTVEKTVLFPKESFKEHLQRKQSDTHEDTPFDFHQKRSFLDSVSMDSLVEIINHEPVFFVGLLCHMMSKEEYAILLSKLPDNLAKIGLNYYTKIRISNPAFLSELSQFYIDRIQKTDIKPQKSNQYYSKDIAEILELFPNSNKDNLRSIIPADISWNVIEDALMTIDDIEFYPEKFQQLIFSTIQSSQEIAQVLSVIQHRIRTNLMKACFTTRQLNIISEEIEHLKSNPLSNQEMIDISNRFIKHIRSLQKNGTIPEITDYKKEPS